MTECVLQDTGDRVAASSQVVVRATVFPVWQCCVFVFGFVGFFLSSSTDRL